MAFRTLITDSINSRICISKAMMWCTGGVPLQGRSFHHYFREAMIHWMYFPEAVSRDRPCRESFHLLGHIRGDGGPRVVIIALEIAISHAVEASGTQEIPLEEDLRVLQSQGSMQSI